MTFVFVLLPNYVPVTFIGINGTRTLIDLVCLFVCFRISLYMP